jgi:hypothetical protein
MKLILSVTRTKVHISNISNFSIKKTNQNLLMDSDPQQFTTEMRCKVSKVLKIYDCGLLGYHTA